MALSGEYDDSSVSSQLTSAVKVKEELTRVAGDLADNASDPHRSLAHKEKAVSSLLWIMMAVLCAPSSEVATFNRSNCSELGEALMRCFESLDLEEQATLVKDKTWMNWILRVGAEAEKRGLAEQMQVFKASDMLKAAARPAEPVTVKKEELDQPFHFRGWVHDIQIALADNPDVQNNAVRGARAAEIIKAIRSTCHSALHYATKPTAHWETVVSAANAYIDIFQIMAVKEDLWESLPKMWQQVREQTMETPICADQYFLRLVKYLSPSQRLDLSWSECSAGNGSIIRAVVELAEKTKGLHVMSALEAVKICLIETHDLADEK